VHEIVNNVSSPLVVYGVDDLIIAVVLIAV
jgi:hypothetical protein